jgi:hypothetical protein
MMTQEDCKVVSEILKKRVAEIKKTFTPEVIVDDVQRAVIIQIRLLAQDLDVAFDENSFIAAVNSASAEPTPVTKPEGYATGIGQKLRVGN